MDSSAGSSSLRSSLIIPAFFSFAVDVVSFPAAVAFAFPITIFLAAAGFFTVPFGAMV